MNLTLLEVKGIACVSDAVCCRLSDGIAPTGFRNVENNYKIAMSRLYRDRDTEADLIEKREALGSVLGRAEAVAEVLNRRETQVGSLGIFQ
ncbi:hypothetical protein F2Q68_00003393 [Brassica cretica]|uniref:Uncharacterized protein n=1 Tax=Brassica cretica TaxID=69181 RepID=A0A8S9J8S2_BRACR|nr:hypothetical protein F2Q68_00003393 [Brassica cretica]